MLRPEESRHCDCLIELVRGPKLRGPPAEVTYDSHSGSLNFHHISTDRSFLQPEKSRGPTSTSGGASKARSFTTLATKPGRGVPGSGKSTLPPRPYLGAERKSESCQSWYG